MKLLSIIIITFNRFKDLIDLLKSIEMLDDLDTFLEEVIIFDNGSTDDNSDLKKYIKQITKKIALNYIENKENLGVSGGRNAACKLAKGENLLLLDDDTILPNKNTLSLINNIFLRENKFSNRPLGIVSLKVKYYDTYEMQQTAFPHKKFNTHKNADHLLISYYIGAAHIIKKDVLQKVGYLPEDFFYGMEEYDLSYRVIDAGYCLLYDSSVSVLHKESPIARKPKKEILAMKWVNKAIVAYRYLPSKYFYSTSFLWSLFYLKQTNFDLKGFINGWKKIFIIKKNNKKKSISDASFKYIKSTNGRLLY